MQPFLEAVESLENQCFLFEILSLNVQHILHMYLELPWFWRNIRWKVRRNLNFVLLKACFELLEIPNSYLDIIQPFLHLNLEYWARVEKPPGDVYKEVAGLLHQHHDAGCGVVVAAVSVHKADGVHQGSQQRPQLCVVCTVNALNMSI